MKELTMFELTNGKYYQTEIDFDATKVENSKNKKEDTTDERI